MFRLFSFLVRVLLIIISVAYSLIVLADEYTDDFKNDIVYNFSWANILEYKNSVSNWPIWGITITESWKVIEVVDIDLFLKSEINSKNIRYGKNNQIWYTYYSNNKKSFGQININFLEKIKKEWKIKDIFHSKLFFTWWQPRYIVYKASSIKGNSKFSGYWVFYWAQSESNLKPKDGFYEATLISEKYIYIVRYLIDDSTLKSISKDGYIDRRLVKRNSKFSEYIEDANSYIIELASSIE